MQAVCEVGGRYFKSMSSIYEMSLCFGFGFSKGTGRSKFPRPPGEAPKTSTEKKIAAMKYRGTLAFNSWTLQKNLKRYTNQHVRKQPFVGLTVLLAAAELREMR